MTNLIIWVYHGSRHGQSNNNFLLDSSRNVIAMVAFYNVTVPAVLGVILKEIINFFLNVS